MALLHGGAGKGGGSRRDGRSVGRRVHGASHHPAEAFDPGALRVSAAPDAARLTAILDRFLFKATLLAITGDSYRMRAHRERLQQLREGVAATLQR